MTSVGVARSGCERCCHQCHAATNSCYLPHTVTHCTYVGAAALRDSSVHANVRTYLEVEGKKKPLYEHSHA